VKEDYVKADDVKVGTVYRFSLHGRASGKGAQSLCTGRVLEILANGQIRVELTEHNVSGHVGEIVRVDSAFCEAVKA
jgi:hypothetical protein